MASTARDDESRRHRSRDIDEDDTLIEVGEDHNLSELEEETDAIDRRRDPLRLPH
jgi:hypothetical protein